MVKKIFIVILLLSLVFISGCAQIKQSLPLPPGTIKEFSIYVEDLPSGIPSRYQSSIDEGIAFWEEQGFKFTKVQNFEDADIQVQWIKEFGGERAGQALNRRLVQIGVGDSLCIGKYQVYTYDTVVLVAAHELGHAIGFEHVDDPNSLMYPLNRWISYETDWNETDIFGPGVVRGTPVCTRDETAEYTFSVESDELVDIVVVADEQEYQNYVNRKPFTEYGGCSAKDVT